MDFKLKVPLFALIVIFGTILKIDAAIPDGYTAHNDFFIISTTSPPALIYVEDSQGRKTGVNPNFQLDSNGVLLDEGGYVDEIPRSAPEQQNIGDDQNNGVPETTTPWLITILDGGSQTYTINLKGISAGIQNVIVKNLPLGRPKNPKGQSFNVLITPNVLKKINVTVTTNTNTTLITRVIGNNDLLNDVKTACQLNLITSHHACKHLEKTAKAIQDALEDHRLEKAEALVKSFLHSLGESVGDGDNDKDDGSSIMEPALTILKEDAKALLAQIEKTETHHEHAKR